MHIYQSLDRCSSSQSEFLQFLPAEVFLFGLIGTEDSDVAEKCHENHGSCLVDSYS